MAPARVQVVVIALVMFAIIGLARAAKPPTASADDYEEEDSDFLIGATGNALSPGGVVAGPIGGPVPPGAFDTQAQAPSAASSSFHHISAVAGAASAALAGFFYL